MNSVSDALQAMLVEFVMLLPKLAVSLVVFVFSLIAAAFFTKLARRVLERRPIKQEIVQLLCNICRWAIISVGTVTALQQVNFDVTAFLAGLGVIGFTIGFALQDVSKNFVSGLLLLLQQPFNIGEAVKIGDFAGAILDIDLRTTEMRTWDGVHVSIPNADVFTSTIVNYSRAPRRRIDIAIGVDYAADFELAREIALETVSAIEGVLKDPAPMVVFNNLGASTADMTVYYWIDTAEVGLFQAKDAGILGIIKRFGEAGIEMPYPIQTVLVKQS